MRAFWLPVLCVLVRTEVFVTSLRIFRASLALVLLDGKVRVCESFMFSTCHDLHHNRCRLTTGQTCEVDINECVRNPCTNGGVCENQRGGFKCRCNPGFSGDLCQNDIDDCAQSKTRRTHTHTPRRHS